MFSTTALNNPNLKPFLRGIDAGKLLFRQGEMGDTMFVILEGVVQLFDETPQGQRLVGTFGPGEFFGEKALLRDHPHQRVFSAQAQVKTRVLQFRLQDIPHIQRFIPEFMLRAFQTAVLRLDRAYHLVRVLKSPNETERLIRCILYFYRMRGKKAEKDSTVLTVEDLHYLINMDKETIKTCLDELTQRNALFKRPDGAYVLRDEHALLDAIPLREMNEEAA